RRHARSPWDAIEAHCAGAAQRDAAVELGAGHAEQVAQDPQQEHVGWRVHRVSLAVDCQCPTGRTRAALATPMKLGAQGLRELIEVTVGRRHWLPFRSNSRFRQRGHLGLLSRESWGLHRLLVSDVVVEDCPWVHWHSPRVLEIKLDERDVVPPNRSQKLLDELYREILSKRSGDSRSRMAHSRPPRLPDERCRRSCDRRRPNAEFVIATLRPSVTGKDSFENGHRASPSPLTWPHRCRPSSAPSCSDPDRTRGDCFSAGGPSLPPGGAWQCC